MADTHHSSVIPEYKIEDNKNKNRLILDSVKYPSLLNEKNRIMALYRVIFNNL